MSNRKKSFLVYLLSASCVLAQSQNTTINLGTQGRNADFANYPFTRPVTIGASVPPTCQVGQLFFNTTAAPGSNLYGCTATNTWTAMASGNINSPQVLVNPTSLSFGTQTVGTSSSVRTITLTNTGTAFLSISGITMTGPNASDFLASNTCGTTVASGASCTISITFQPSTTADETASVAISGNEPGSPVLVNVSGTGAAVVSSGGLVVTPSASYAAVNDSVTFVSNRPVNWALAAGSSGTLNVTSSTSATYNAPGSIPAQNVMGGCQVTPNDSVFNTRIDNLPLESHSAVWAANTGTINLNFSPSWGTNIADATTSTKSMIFFKLPITTARLFFPNGRL